MKDRIYTLSNGLRVANFSSPHPFTFTDGTVIPAVSEELSKRTMLDAEEIIIEKDGIKNVIIKWNFTQDVLKELYKWETLHEKGHVDVVLIPLPVMSAFKEAGQTSYDMLDSVFRVIRVADRITKVIHIDKFCV